jgi:hypothetical protein
MSACKTIKYQSINVIQSLSPTDELIIVINGQPQKMSIADFLMAIAHAGSLPAYVDEKAARLAGLQNNEKFKAAKPNKMGVPPGTIIELI